MTVSSYELDALRELINIGVGRAAGALNEMANRPVQLNVPWVDLIEPGTIRNALHSPPGCRLACVRLRFQGRLRGAADLVFPSESGSKLVGLITGDDASPRALDSLRAETLTEVGNVLLNGLMGSIANVVREHLDYGLPLYLEETAEGLEENLRLMPDTAVLLAQAQFFVGRGEFEIGGERIDGEITLLLGVDSLEHLIHRVQSLGDESLM